MQINQFHEEFNGEFETYFPKMQGILRRVYVVFTNLCEYMVKLRRIIFKGVILTNERIVEYPLVLRWVRPGGLVLDIGCVSSKLPIQLASLGYTVHGIDLRDYSMKHPNFSFFRGDIMAWKPQYRYDIITAVSSLEHMGIGSYGDAPESDVDKRVVEKLYGILQPAGQLLVSVPFGKYGVTPKHRIYDRQRLQELFKNFHWKQTACFIRKNHAWVPASLEDLVPVSSLSLPVNGVVVLDLEKK